jgi:silicon transporter
LACCNRHFRIGDNKPTLLAISKSNKSNNNAINKLHSQFHIWRKANLTAFHPFFFLIPTQTNKYKHILQAVTMVDACNLIKYVYSTILLIFSIIIIMGLIYNADTSLSDQVHPALAYVAIWGAIIWLTMVEGGQGSLVGLAPVNGDLFKDTHKLAYQCTSLAHKGDNLDRYLMGRQFMVVLIVFIVNMSGGPLPDTELWGFPDAITFIFFGTGMAMVLFTCMVGQLNSQINGCHCMLDYINNYFAVFTLYVAMAIEFSGLLHSSYLIQMAVAAMSGKPIESQEAPRDGAQNAFFYARCLFSVVALGLALLVTIGALFQGKTTAWEGVPNGISVIVFFVLMSVVGLLEGMQIAFFAVAKLTKLERGTGVFAMKTCEVLFRGEGRNLPGFMVGRQICVVSCMFVVARITTLNVDTDEGDETIFGVSNGLQAFFNTGLLGALITTILGSIAWQLVASAFPIAFLSNPLVYVFLRLCLLLESTGICSGAWVLAAIHKKIAGFQRDEVYIGTAEERAAKNQGDMADNDHMGPGHPRKLPGFADTAPKALRELMMADPSVMEYMDSVRKMDDDDEA